MNFEVFSIGTSGMMPLPGRFLTSALVRREGEMFLFDCGEGTQVSLKLLSLSWKRISRIFISHMHADHVTGLPGLLMLSSQVDRSEPLTIYGPQRLGEYIDSSRRILDMYINYPIIFQSVEEGVVYEDDALCVNAFMLRHTKLCYGYSLVEKPRPGEFSVEKALAHKVPRGPLWSALQHGQSVLNEDGQLVEPSMVLGQKREGRKFTYITDTQYFPELADYAHDSDILFCEGMFDSSLEADAAEKKHMTAAQAAMVAKDAHAAKLCLQHYSPRYSDRELRLLLEEAKAIFPETVLTRDRMSFVVPLKN
ncbi:MAG: ribonuclease Z [Spirochaetes bacterium]|uniref:Ribonuclease Z n=1 Tax=Candidatus Aphodenecus pullistercoris TaxID=2840669 RepID=A0A9D9E8T0_9SPIR|nr:ribonuclease Z [Candidatus Aphodenecus pullistercoris]